MKRIPDVLVLNKAYTPLHIIIWKKAISLIYQEHAHAMDRDYCLYRTFDEWIKFSSDNKNIYPHVNTVKHCISIPEIIVLSVYDKLPQRDVKFSRQSVFGRDNYICCYCGKTFTRDVLTIDHIIPRALGGKTVWNNVVTSCKPCNSFKRDRTPKDAGLKMLYAPKKPKWISPIANAEKEHVCKSWRLFLNKANVDLG